MKLLLLFCASILLFSCGSKKEKTNQLEPVKTVHNNKLKNDSLSRLEWLTTYEGLYPFVNDIINDNEGNTFVTAINCNDTIDDNGRSLRMREMLLMKVNQQGNTIWARKFFTDSYDNRNSSNSIALDSIGNIFLAGEFGGTTTFSSKKTHCTLSSKGELDGFLTKINTNGDIEWCISPVSGEYTQRVKGIVVGRNNDIYLTGFYGGKSDMNPSSDSLFFSSNTLSSFISKINSSGELVWFKNFEGYSNAHSICMDENENIYANGRFWDTCNFNPQGENGIIESIGNQAGFLVKLSSDGNFIWVKHFKSTENTGVGSFYLEYEKGEGVILSGSCKLPNTLLIDSLTFHLNKPDSLAVRGSNSFLCKITPVGEIVFLQSGLEKHHSIATTQDNFVYTSTVLKIDDRYPNSISVCKWDTKRGQLLSEQILLGEEGKEGSRFVDVARLSVDLNNNVYISGTFFGQFSDKNIHSKKSTMSDIFVGKLD